MLEDSARLRIARWSDSGIDGALFDSRISRSHDITVLGPPGSFQWIRVLLADNILIFKRVSRQKQQGKTRMTRTDSRRGGARGCEGIRLSLITILMMCAGVRAHAQSLDDQYTYYLTGKCQNMGFQRDADNVLLPGQAGPHLEAFCSGPIAVGGGNETTSLGGGAAAEEISNSGGEEEQALKRRRGRLRDANASADAAADATADTELASFGATSVFASFDYLNERQSTTTYEAGRHSSGYGGLLGMDRRFGAKALAGIAVRYAEQSGTLDSGGDFSVHTPGVRVYGSWLPVDGLFIDAAAGFDRRSLDTRRIVGLRVVTFGSPLYPGIVSYNPPLLPATSNTHERDYTGELHAGYDWSLSSLTIGPRAAVTAAHSALDPYVESGDTPMTLAVNAQTRISLRSQVGFQVSDALKLPTGVLVPQLEAEWVHEYRDDQRLSSAHFAEDLRPQPVELHFLNNPPDRDWFVVRVATVAVLPHGVSAFAAVERFAGNLYIERYQATLGLRCEL
jgi:uncharacterized protein YhjY with autotransporter beta-barrel domain